MAEQFDLKCFGTADGAPSAERGHAAFLFKFGTASILVDCGEPLCRSYKEAQFSFDRLDRIVVSHLHFDHLGGFFMFVQGLWLEKRRREMGVHLPADGIGPIRQLLEAACLCEETLPFRLCFEPLRDRETFTVKHVRVTPFLNTHLDGFKRALQKTHTLRFESFSFLFETEGLRVAHSADLGAVTDLEPLLAEPLDLLVCELAHFRPETICDYLRGRALRCVAFVHLGREPRARFAEVSKLVQRRLPGVTVLYPNDGQVLGLRAALGI
jgi:ribonuclease BN (tRNA processing enzyme)